MPYAIITLGLSAGAVGATLVAIGPVAGVCSALAMLATLRFPSALLAAFSFFLLGAGPVLWVISTGTLRQSVTPPQLLGRVSAMFTLAQGSRPVGAVIGALIGGIYGDQACLVAVAAVFVIQAVSILASPVINLKRQPGYV